MSLTDAEIAASPNPAAETTPAADTIACVAPVRRPLQHSPPHRRGSLSASARPLRGVGSRAEGAYQLEPRDDLTPEKLFDRRWALLLLERVLTRLREHHASPRKAALFAHLQGLLTGGSSEVPYAEIAQALGMTEGAVKVAAHRLRRQFRDLLVEEIAETVSDVVEIDGEIAYLLRAVSE